MTTKEKKNSIWITITILSLLVISVSSFFLNFSEMTFDVTMENSGSSLTLESLDEKAKGGAHFLADRPFIDEVWLGILGLFCAWGLKKRVSFAWNLGVFWSVMLIAIGIVMAINQVIVLGWGNPCLAAIDFLLVGGIALASLLRVKKEFA